MKVTRHSALSVPTSSHQSVFATSLRSSVSSFHTDLFDAECTQDLEQRDGYFEHVPNSICAQQMYSKCEATEDLNIDCARMVNVFTCSGRTTYF